MKALGRWRQRLLQGCYYCCSASQLQLGVISSASCKWLWNRRALMYITPIQHLHNHRNLVTHIRGLGTCPATLRLLIFVQMYVFYYLRLGTVQCLFKAQRDLIITLFYNTVSIMLVFMAHSLEWTGLQMRNRHSEVLGTNDNPDSLILSWAQAFSVGFVELCRMGLKPSHSKECCWWSLWLQLPKGHPGVWVFKNLPGSTINI